MTVFVFYSKSSDKPPGKGAGEKLTEPANTYSELSKIPEWRKKLSNFYHAPFTLDGKMWNGVEYYFHAQKFPDHPEFANQFTADAVDSNGIPYPWNHKPEVAKSMGGRSGKYSPARNKKGKPTGNTDIKGIRPKNVVMRDDFYDGIDINGKQMSPSSLALMLGQYAKFSQNPELGRMLLATGDATLSHYVKVMGRGAQYIIEYDLMKVRDCLRKYWSRIQKHKELQYLEYKI